jgi:hypothetical protein
MLGVTPVPPAGPLGAWRIVLGPADLELVPWRREGPADEPGAAGRLVFEPLEGEALGRVSDDGPEDPSMALAGVVWATVELDRAAVELDQWLDPAVDGRADDPEPHLGARTRPRGSAGLPGDTLVLAEPSTEGRLAASLARDGEGPCAIYLRPRGGLDAWLGEARRRGVGVSSVRVGPLGRSVLLPGAAAGPHLIVVDDRAP